jgi:uncharacterized membrane protein
MPTLEARVPSPALARTRIQSIDTLRGRVMIIMAIDHTRDFLHYVAQQFSPEDLTQTNVVLFFTRWFTHFCAPVFVFLAGTSAYLSARRGKSPAEVSRFLLTRGLWLLFVEMGLIALGASFDITYTNIVWQVIWAIGWSMIALSALIFLPWNVLLAFSLIMIVGHDTLDGLKPEQFGAFAWLWQTLHVGFTLIQPMKSHTFIVIYPLIPWIGVMSAGYCFGRVMDLDAAHRQRMLWRLGVGLIAAFVALRLINVYGDPSPWTSQPRAVMTFLSFLAASKYPPSLLYLLMTLGPALIVLALMERMPVGDRNPLLVFGKVPLFYYIIHWYLLHCVAIGLAWSRYGRIGFLFGLPPSMLPWSVGYPADYGYPLWVVYVVWAAAVTALYPLCAWFAGVKARNRSAWLSYL